MKKQPISFSWPASLSDFSTDPVKGNFSRGKLKVFYKGETADHRYFSDSFSEELMKSLPYTPVVSYYDEEKDDFVGHATEQQILGIVDPLVTPVFENDEDNHTWAVCDVVLYTERPDRVGDLAKKIAGHSQSLELDPKTVKYTINYDEKRHFKNVEFTAGTFVGVSVLGKDQKPAFTGSEFFAYNDTFANKMEILRHYCEEKNGHGGKVMNLSEFMKLSWGDISLKVEEALVKEYGEEAFTSIVDMFSDSVIVRFYSYLDGSMKLFRMNYTCSESGEISLGAVNEVHVVYEDVATMTEETGVEQTTECSTDCSDNTEEKENCACDPEKKKEKCENDQTEDCACGSDKKKKDLECKPEEDKKSEEGECACGPKDDKKKCECDPRKRPEGHPDVKPGDPLPPGHPDIDDDEDDKDDDDEDYRKKRGCCSEVVDAAASSTAEEAAQVTNAEVTETEEKVSVENENFETEETSSSTTFAEGQRAELEELKREKKVTLLDSYKQYLSEEEVNDFTSHIDEIDYDKLECDLLKIYKKKQEEAPKTRAFALRSPNTNASKDSLDSFVRKYRG